MKMTSKQISKARNDGQLTTGRRSFHCRVPCNRGVVRIRRKGVQLPKRTSLRVGTWNVTSLAGKEPELVGEVNRFGLDIVGITSHHYSGSGSKLLDQGWTLNYSGVTNGKRRQAGVGILTSPRLSFVVEKFNPVNERLAALRLLVKEGKGITVVCAYAPNNISEYGVFVDDLQELLYRTPVGDSLVILGDFNAHVGNDSGTWKGVVGKNGLSDLNASGVELLHFCSRNNLCITNTMFEHKEVHRCTWHQDSLDQKSMIDFVIVSSDLRRCVLDTRVKRGAELSTDHYLVVSKLRWENRMLDKPGKPKRCVRARYERLVDDSVKERFTSYIREDFSRLPEEVKSIDQEWEMFRSSLAKATVQSCGSKALGACRGGNLRTAWWTPTVRDFVRQKKAAYKATLSDKSVEAVNKYRKAKRASARAVAEAKKATWEKFGECLELNYRSASKMFWRTVRNIRVGKQKTPQTVYDKSGSMLTSIESILDCWKEHFSGLFNPVDMPSLVEVESLESIAESISLEEVTAVVNRLRSNKSAGVDEIRPEVLKALDVVGMKWLTRIFNVALKSGKVPSDWRTGVVVPIYKKGDRKVCSNYRGITLLSQPGKLFARILELRIRPIVEGQLLEDQCGFRSGRGTMDQLFTLSIILERSWEFAQPVYMCFVDLEKAFDRVPREKLWEVLREYRVPHYLRVAVASLYEQSTSCVRVLGRKSELFPVGIGLRQGCPLSPLLFLVYMDRIVRRASLADVGLQFGAIKIPSLLFADDVVLLASRSEDLQCLLDRFTMECQAAKMSVSTSKTVTMCSSRTPEPLSIRIVDTVLPDVKEFKYLGVLFSSEDRNTKEIEKRICAANAVMRSLYRSVVVKRELSLRAKLSVYRAIFVPILTYGHELWVMTERTRSRVQAAEMRFLRGVAGLSLSDKVRNSVIRENLGVKPLLLHVEGSQLRWLGHVLRMPSERLPRLAFQTRLLGKRPRGRPRYRWRDQISKLAEERFGLSEQVLWSVARDRDCWSSLIRSLPPRPDYRTSG